MRLKSGKEIPWEQLEEHIDQAARFFFYVGDAKDTNAIRDGIDEDAYFRANCSAEEALEVIRYVKDTAWQMQNDLNKKYTEVMAFLSTK